MFAAVLICGLTVSSCQKDPTPEPVKQTVLAGMMNNTEYDSITFSYEYDAEYRLVRSEARQTNSNQIIQDFRFTYTDGHIKVEGTSYDDPVTYDCTVDSLGHITQIEMNAIYSDTITANTHFEYTYDADGHIATSFRNSDPDSEGSNTTFVWEGEEMKSSHTGNDLIVVDFETSDAPAQAMLRLFGYHAELSELCAQGCFGKLPTHMPSKRTVTTAFPIPGMDPNVFTFDYTYTTNAEGRLATYEENSSNGFASGSFNWEER